jgi:hypothetical protein
MKFSYLMSAAVLAGATLVSGCGSDDSDDNYRGYMPRFASDVLKSGPAQALNRVLQLEASQSEDSGSEASRPEVSRSEASPQQLPQAVTLMAIAEQPGDSSPQADDEHTALAFDALDCRGATDFWNAAPQAADFSNSAVAFILNLQAQTVFYDCVIREQVFNHGARISQANDISTVATAFNDDGNSYFASWTLPTSVLNASSARELQIESQGILVNLQPGIDSSKTRVDLTQNVADGVFSKTIRSTLQDRLTSTTNIRSVTFSERKNSAGELLQQSIKGRIIFANNLTVVSAVFQPGVGAASYMKQCADNQRADDYLRDCDNRWQEVLYNDRFEVVTDANQQAQIRTALAVGEGAVSLAPEQRFYNAEAESSFFAQRSLP